MTTDPLAERVASVVETHLDVDIDAASALSGSEVRIGYPYPSARFAAMVDSIEGDPAGRPTRSPAASDRAVSS